jgi:hypothetical protein
MLGEEPGCLDQEPGAGLGGLVRQDLADGDPGAAIDGRVDIVVADPTPPCCGGPAVDAVAATIGMRPSFLTSMWTSSPGCSRW